MNNGKKQSKAPVIVAIIFGALIIAGAAVVTPIICASLNKDNENVAGGDGGGSDNKPESEPKNEPQKSDRGDGHVDHSRGKEDSTVTVIEYADMQCPGCASLMPQMNKIYEKYGDRVRFVFRHYPISSHQNASTAAKAVEAAGEQGYFWEMLSKMFEMRTEWMQLSGDKLKEAYVEVFNKATQNKGDVEKFKSELGSKEIAARIVADKKLGEADNLSATPMVLVNGKEVSFGSGTITQLVNNITDMIDEALAK